MKDCLEAFVNALNSGWEMMNPRPSRGQKQRRAHNCQIREKGNVGSHNPWVSSYSLTAEPVSLFKIIARLSRPQIARRIYSL